MGNKDLQKTEKKKEKKIEKNEYRKSPLGIKKLFEKGGSKKARNKRRKEQNLKKDDRGGEADQNEDHVSPADEDCLQMKGKSKESKKKKKKKREHDSSKEAEKEEGGTYKFDASLISSGDEDVSKGNSKGMKTWITRYRQSIQPFDVLQHRIDDFLTAHEEQLEQEREEREAQAAEGGWTVVTHHKGRKKTTDVESGITVGSVAQAAVEGKMAQKKDKGVGLNFYRSQRKEAQRNEIMKLQSKFEEDKKRIQQLRAARKFRPY